MKNKLSYKWAFAVAIFFPLLQVLIFYLRFQTLNPEASFAEYLAFFISGLLIGLAFIYLLRRSDSVTARRGTVIGFLVGIPIALFGMIVGGLTGAFGAVLFSISPTIFVIGLGHMIGLIKGKKQ